MSSFSTPEVARQLGANPQKLRHLIGRGIPAPTKNKHGNYVWSLEDVARAAERDRAMRPGNPGYVAGLAKWRREQALKKPGSRSGGCSSPNETESTWLGQRMHPTPRHRSAQDETS